MAYNLPDGCTEADIENWWGKEDSESENQAYVAKCKAELYAVIDRFSIPQGLLISEKDRQHAKACLDDVVADLFYNFLKED